MAESLDRPESTTTTLASYEQGIAAYLDHSTATPTAAHAEFRRRILALLPEHSQMLELGSGPGHDAAFFEQQGVDVRRTDGTAAFVERLLASGYRAELLDMTTNPFGGPYDIVFANAVLLHLTAEQLDVVLTKAAGAVRAGSLLAFTVKEGDGHAWTTSKLGLPRFFTYWREPALQARLDNCGWSPLSVEHVQGRSEPWLYVLCRLAPKQ